jgi:hypothetical protein
MKTEDYNLIMTQIGEGLADPEKVDVPKITSLLSKVRDDYGETQAELTKVTEERDTNKKAYEEAIKYNMQMFLSKAVKTAEPQKELSLDDKKPSFNDLDLSDF